MAGQIPLDVRYYPGDFQLAAWAIHAPNHNRYPLWFPDRNVVVDSVVLFLEDAPNQNINVKVVAAPAPNLPNYGTPITGQVDLTTALSLTTGATYPQLDSTNLTNGFTLNRANNLVLAPFGIWLLSSGNFSGVTGNLHVQVRWRSTF